MPRVKTLKGEIGTSGQMEAVTLTGLPGVDIAEAVGLEHPCDDAGCDIARAREDDYPFWSANLLQGATETPLLDTVISYYCALGLDFGALAEADRIAWLASDTWTEHAHTCPSCNSVTFGDDYWTPEQCENCLAPLEAKDE